MITDPSDTRSLAGVRVIIDPSADGPEDATTAALALGRLAAVVLMEQAIVSNSTAA
jgi:hypothetical protein